VAGFRSLAAGDSGGRPVEGAGDGERWEVEVVHHAGPGWELAYRVVVAGSRRAPAFLSCADGAPKAEVNYVALTFSRLP
jgi:hypothetical protein